MNILKRAQTATEYLIILAVVIIIALIVVGVLGGIPGIGGGSADSLTHLSWQTNNQVGIPSLSINTLGNVTMTLKNNRANNIRIENIYMNGSISTRDAGGSVHSQAVTINAGQTSSTIDFNLVNTTCPGAGEGVALYIMIEYEDLTTGSTYNFSNRNQAYQTTCASG
ncbi:MAG: hypothetical protein ACMXYC_02715 [Candidatus Woesearchaeota archaeon]